MAGNFPGVLYFVKSQKKAQEVDFVVLIFEPATRLATPTEIPKYLHACAN